MVIRRIITGDVCSFLMPAHVSFMGPWGVSRTGCGTRENTTQKGATAKELIHQALACAAGRLTGTSGVGHEGDPAGQGGSSAS